MAKIYRDLINLGLWELDNVPMQWYDQTVTLLEADKEKENK